MKLLHEHRRKGNNSSLLPRWSMLKPRKKSKVGLIWNSTYTLNKVESYVWHQRIVHRRWRRIHVPTCHVECSCHQSGQSEKMLYYILYVYIYIHILPSKLKWDDWSSWQGVTGTSNPLRAKDKLKCCISGAEIVMSKSKGQQLRRTRSMFNNLISDNILMCLQLFTQPQQVYLDD